MSHHYEKRRSEEPTEPKVHRRQTPGHFFDVIAQPSHAVKPGDRDQLEECQEHDGHRGGVVIYQLEEINTTLRQSGNRLVANKCLLSINKCRLDCYYTCVIFGSPNKNETTHMRRTSISWQSRWRFTQFGNPSWIDVTTTSTTANWNPEVCVIPWKYCKTLSNYRDL